MKRITFAIIAVPLLFGCGEDAAKFKVLGSSSSGSRAALSALVLNPTADFSRVVIGTPTSFKITLYKAWVSQNTDCSSPIVLQDYGASGQQFNMMDSPTLFSGNPPDGTYPCLILKFNDNMKFKANDVAVANHAGCANTTTEYTFDVYRDGESDDGAWIDIDGNGVDATGSAASPSGDQAYAFGSTSPSATTANGVATNINQRLTLTSGLVVPGQTTYYWDATNGVSNHNSGGSNYCWIETVTSGFR